jgi:hypothetical protein
VKHGGTRPGAGRPEGSRNRATNASKQRLSELAQQHTELAIKTLVQIATDGCSDSARVSAVNSILDRAYGKPTQRSDVSFLDTELPTTIQLIPIPSSQLLNS